MSMCVYILKAFFYEDIVLLLVLLKDNVILLHCVEVTLRARKPETLCGK